MWKVLIKYPIDDKVKKRYISKRIYFLFNIPIWSSVEVREH